MVIRQATLQDWSRLHEIRLSVKENVLSDPNKVTRQDYLAMLSYRGRGWVCEIAGEVVGFAIIDIEAANIWALFVRPGFEGMGIGRKLHDVMMEYGFGQGLTNFWLTTEAGSRAERFYRRNGWKHTGNEPNGELRFELDKDDSQKNE
jgi:GNAT superfamily N-acetyltransferase